MSIAKISTLRKFIVKAHENKGLNLVLSVVLNKCVLSILFQISKKFLLISVVQNKYIIFI